MAVRRVLLDADMIIAAFDSAGRTDAMMAAESRAEVSALFEDEDVALAITPLLRYEVLRGVALADERRFRRLREDLDEFEEIAVTREVSDLAADLFRLDRTERSDGSVYAIDKRRFDAFHVATAKTFDLELVTRDQGVRSLLDLCGRLELIRSSAPSRPSR